jgi:hypothetical protein
MRHYIIKNCNEATLWVKVRCYVNLLMFQYALSCFLSNARSLFLQTSEHLELIKKWST